MKQRSIKKKPIVALIYDFDKTLCTKDMQEYGFIPSLGMTPEAFWAEAAALTDREQMDHILAYMWLMVRKSNEAGVRIMERDFNELGQDVTFFKGVMEWFAQINGYAETLGIQLEHYIISSGIKEIIDGTPIAGAFQKIYGCEFLYDHNGVIQWPKVAVNYTAKTQFLFRINKGVLHLTDASSKELNQYTPEQDRRIPFQHMIYIGDGLTDVPCMKLVKSYGGHAIAVFDQKNGNEVAQTLLKDNRVNHIAPADYRTSKPLDTLVRAILRQLHANHEITLLDANNTGGGSKRIPKDVKGRLRRAEGKG